MATATKPKTSPLAELETLEAKWAEAAEVRRDLGRQHKEQQDAARGLIDQRERLLRRDPGQYNADNSPREQGSEAARIQAEFDGLGQYDFSAEIAHAQRLEQNAKEAVYAHIASNLDAIVEALQPDGEAAVAAVQERAASLADAADIYLALAKRVDGLRAADRQLAQVRVRAIDPGAELVRVVAGYRDAPLPLPTELRYPGQP